MSVAKLLIAGDDLDVVNGFRKSFNREHLEFTERDAGLLLRGMNDGHTEPSRHAWAKFGIVCSVGAARQLMTHKRYLAISEHSTRYSRMPDEFVMPPLKLQIGKPMEYQYVEAPPELKARGVVIVKHSYERAYSDYQELLNLGFAREDARYVLQLGLQTSLIASGDLIAWLRFLARRTDPHAQDEIRGIATEIEGHLREAFPHSLNAWDAAGRRAP